MGRIEETQVLTHTARLLGTVITAAYDYMGRRAWKKVETIATDPATGEETATITLHQRYIYRGYLQVAAGDLTRGGHPCLWLITTRSLVL